MTEKQDSDTIRTSSASMEGRGLSAGPHVSAKPSKVPPYRKVLQSSWIQRLKPFDTSDQKEEVSIVSPGHVWTHFSKDFSSSSKRLGRSLIHHRSSTPSLPDESRFQTKPVKDEEIHSSGDHSRNHILPFALSDELLDKSLHHGSSNSSWPSDGRLSESTKPSRNEEAGSLRKTLGDCIIPFVPSEENLSRRGNSRSRVMPFVPSEGNTSQSSDISLRTWNIFSGCRNTYNNRPSSFTEDLVPSSQNREDQSVEKLKELCERSDARICITEVSSSHPSPQQVTHDKNKSSWAVEGRNFGFLKPPLHPKSFSKSVMTLKSVSIQFGENVLLSATAREEVHAGNVVQGNQEKQQFFLDEPSPHAENAPPPESASWNDFNTSIPRPQDFLFLKPQHLKDRSKNSCLENTSRPLSIVANVANNEPNKIAHEKGKRGTKANFGFLLFPRKSSSRNYECTDNNNTPRDTEDFNAVKIDAFNQLQNAPETYTVNDSKVAGSANQNSDGPVNGSNSNLIEPNRNLYSDEVAASTPSVEKPSLEDQSRSSFPKVRANDYWSEWMEIWDKSATPVKRDKMISPTESLWQDYILDEFRKSPDHINRGQKLKEFSSSIEHMHGKESSGFLQQRHIMPVKECRIPCSPEKRGHLYEGASGSGAVKNRDLNSMQRFQFDDTSNIQQLCTSKESSRHSGGQAWIQRWCSSTSIDEVSDKITSFIPKANRNVRSNWCSSVEESGHKTKQKINTSSTELKGFASINKHIKIPPSHSSSNSTSQAPQVLVPAYTSHVSDLGNFVRSQAGQAMAMVGNTALKASLLQRSGSLCVWTCDITSPEIENDSDFPEDKFHLDMEDF